MFPPNVLKAAVDMNVLGVITFCVFFGVMLGRLSAEDAAPILRYYSRRSRTGAARSRCRIVFEPPRWAPTPR